MTFLTSTLQIYLKTDDFSDMFEYEIWVTDKAPYFIISLLGDTLIVFVSESRAEIHESQIFGGHLYRHLRKYATIVIYFYIFKLHVLHFV